MSRRCFVCHACGSQVTHDADQLPCELLSGWIMVSQWTAPGEVEHHSFCCFTCLRTWMDGQAPEVPDVFLRAFDE